jgi:hypothetical protein
MIKSILQKLFASYKKNNDNIPVNNTITFWIGDDGIPYAKIYIVDTSDKSVEPLAELLFGINTGEYMNYMLNILISISGQDIQINNYVKKVLSDWQNLIDHGITISPNEEPYVKPTTFNTKHNE